MSALSDYAENKILDHLLGTSAYTFPSQAYLGLSTASLADDNSGTRLDTLKEHVDRCGRARLIIARCDSDEAVRFGQSLGSTVYQGHYIDRLLANS